MGTQIKNNDLESRLWGLWNSFIIDRATRTDVRELFTPNGGYAMEIRNPDAVGRQIVWGSWSLTIDMINVAVEDSTIPGFLQKGDRIVMHAVAINENVMTHRDQAGNLWVNLRLPE
jgi:hypothetical protein